MKILHYVNDMTAIFLYRCYFPMFAIQKYTNHNVMVSTICSDTNIHNLAEINWADVVIFHRQHLKVHIEIAKKIQLMGKKVIYEIDDDWFHLNDDNSFKKKIDSDPSILKGLEEFLEIADAVTVSTFRLAKILEKYNSNIYVLPNYISKHYFDHNKKEQEKEKGKISLFWAGAANHLDDIKMLAEPLKQIFKKYDNLCFYNAGQNYTKELWFIPKNKLIYVPWTNIEDYPANYGFADIILAPMTDNLFNAAKSNIRILEASYYGIPIVASNKYTYKESITQFDNGLLCDTPEDWVNNLSILIESEEKREIMGINAKKYADSMTIEDNYMKYVDTYKEISDGK